MTQSTWPSTSELPAIPKVRILGEIGRGLHSTVYRCVRDGQTYALKIPRLNGTQSPTMAAAAFRREASALALVRHPSLPEVIEVDHYNEMPYIIMELVQGQTLLDLVELGPLPESMVIRLAKDLASALAAVHRQGITHRDIQPRNMLIQPSGEVKLIDFGFAIHNSLDPEQIHVLGTLRYSSPEQTGYLKRTVDARSDLYALGAVLFECLVGVPPFNSSNIADLMRQHALVPAPDVRSLAGHVSAALAEIIARLLAKDPDDRYQTAEGLLSDINQLDSLNLMLAAGRPIRLGADDLWTGVLYDNDLIGRDAELTVLRQGWNSARQGHGSVIVIKGAMGLGKSQLGREILHRARSLGGLTFGSTCVKDSALPYSALRSPFEQYLHYLELMPESQRRHAEEQLRQLVQGYQELMVRTFPDLQPILPPTKQPEIAVDYERFNAILADLLLWMTRVHPAAVWFIDDLQAIDDASFNVVRRVIGRIQQVPLCVIISLNASLDGQQIYERLTSNQPIPIQLIELQPLSDVAATQFITSYLGGYSVDQQIINEIVARSVGSPFALREYIQTLLDTGMLRLVNNCWMIDDQSLTKLALPSHVVRLVLGRIDELSPKVRDILELAAVLGFQFRRNSLLELWHGEASEVDEALTIGGRSHLIERSASGHYHFAHQNIYQVFLEGIAPEQQQQLHAQIAKNLDHEQLEPEAMYQLAYHYARAKSHDPAFLARGFTILSNAGQVALEKYAYDEAYHFFEQAYQIAQGQALIFQPQQHAQFAQLCLRLGQNQTALLHLQAALEETNDSDQRARLLVAIAHIYAWQQQPREIWRYFDQAFQALGEPALERTLTGLVGDIGRSLGRLLGSSCTWIRPSSELQQQRIIILLEIYDTVGMYAYLNSQMLLLVSLFLRSLVWARRGRSRPARVRALSNYASMWAMTGQNRLAKRALSKAKTIANTPSLDPVLQARVGLYEGFISHILGAEVQAERLLRSTLRQYATTIDSLSYGHAVADSVLLLFLRGHVLEAWQLVQETFERFEQHNHHNEQTWFLKLWAAPLLISLGFTAEAQRYPVPEIKARQQWLLAWQNLADASQMIVNLEQGDPGQQNDQLLRHFNRQRRNNPRFMPFHSRYVYMLQGYIRIAQFLQQRKRFALRRLRIAARQALVVATTPILRGHALVIVAAAHGFDGHFAQALTLLGQAEQLAHLHDAPWILYEAHRIRAHLFGMQQQMAAAKREASRAYTIAFDHQWVLRMRHVAQSFQLDDPERLNSTTSIISEEGLRPDDSRMQRLLDALLSVSLAWAQSYDLDEQAQTALDSVIRILGAERAFLFLLENDELQLRAARDAASNQLSEGLQGYSRTVLERVRITKKPVIVSGADDALIISSESVTAHNLRSVLAAPLMLDGQFLGVVYLDNRLAWGFFSQEDEIILRAVTTHIALGLEKSRTTQLEMHIRAEREQRRLAEHLRQLSTVLNATLDLADVLKFVLNQLNSLLPYYGACIALCDDVYLKFEHVESPSPTLWMRGTKIISSDDALFTALATTRQPLIVNDIVKDSRFNGYGEHPARSWLGLPLLARGEIIGFMAIDRDEPNAISEHEAELGMTFASQAAVAIANAQLFGQVQRLAITDSLTQVNNRRHFFELAERQWVLTSSSDHPLAAMMLDVDHFKRVNDTYGHSVGDLVLRTVADLCRANLRPTDLLGRYGGEEFAILLPDTDVSAALTIAERLRLAIGRHQIQHEQASIRLTVSIGVTGLSKDDTSVASLLDRADRGLYIAKETGRDRVMMA
ncbi:diguanylate cyclase [Herpetosiphon sp. NSE202]|uniref:diguanylate cyclase n=1 Tax=Herpetosiphon sp. NSE202 TaxID=3351349 RepID=UPI00362D8E0E